VAQVIRGFGVLKKCAAQYNMKAGKLDPRLAEAMMAAADEVVSGQLDDHVSAARIITRIGYGTSSGVPLLHRGHGLWAGGGAVWASCPAAAWWWYHRSRARSSRW
jgi:hypothetical protein